MTTIVEIVTSDGSVVIVDDCDADLAERRWSKSKGYARGYAGGGRKNPKFELMHRVILERVLGRPIAGETDHINRNRLDNRRCNLRECSHTGNMMNRPGWKTSGKAKAKGVKFLSDERRTRPWMARIAANGTRVHLGCFATEEEAAAAYRHAAQTYHGEFADA